MSSSMNLSEKTWPFVENYLKSSQSIIVPVGSTEQHGPTGILGIDYLTSASIAGAVGLKTQTLVAPPLCFGMALHHMAFPGTMTLTPTTYILVITEIIQSLAKHGFEKIIFINGHGGNIAPLTSAFSQVLQNNEAYSLNLINWWHLPEVNEYEKKVFGDDNGFHATCGEISVTMHTHPQAYEGISMQQEYPKTPQKHSWPLSPTEFRNTFKDGRMNSNPALANSTHGGIIFQIAVDSIVKKMKMNLISS